MFNNMILAILLCLLLRDGFPVMHLFIWVLLVFAVSILRLMIANAFHLAQKRGPLDLSTWLFRYRAGVFLSALAWGLSGYVFFDQGDLPHQLYLTVILASMVHGAAYSQTAIPKAFPIYLFVVTVPMLLNYLISNTEVQMILGMTLCLLLVVLWLSSRKVYHMINESIELRYELERTSLFDGLTRVSNRRHFEQHFDEEWRRARRNHTELAVILIDVDHFKAYNDYYGHQGGDEALIAVGQILKGSVKRARDMVARYGGEEFAAILPDTDLEGAKVVAEAMLEGFSREHIPHATSPTAKHLTASLGVAVCLVERHISSNELVVAADQALYNAKEAGRNRIIYTCLDEVTKETSENS